MNRHIKNIHQEEKSFVCGNCKNRFTLESQLRNHAIFRKTCRSSHRASSSSSSSSCQSEDKKFKCDCGESFTRKGNLKNHKNFRCRNTIATRGTLENSSGKRFSFLQLLLQANKASFLVSHFFSNPKYELNMIPTYTLIKKIISP